MIPALNFARIISVLALGFVLCACSAIKLGYNNIDEVAYWWLDDYVDFEDNQTPRVRQDLARLHSWHRGNELPRYAEVLQKMERLAPADVTPAQLCGFVGEIRERLEVLSSQAEPAVVTVALGLTPDQLTHLERKYAKSNADYRKEWIERSPEKQFERRFKQLLERSETMYGSLGDTQRAAIRRQIERSSFDPQRFLVERQRRQQDILQTLRKIAGQPLPLNEARGLMRGYLERVNQSPNPAYRVQQQALIQENCNGIAATHNSTTLAQREHAVQRLRSYQNDLRELAAKR